MTGVLQGSVLSPFLYSIFINSLPALLRQVEEENYHTIQDDLETPAGAPRINGLKINCLLYADDVVLLGIKETMPTILQACERHSQSLGYRWNPAKCVTLAPDGQ